MSLFVNENHKYVMRYQSQAIPRWFGLPYKAIDFRKTGHFNDLSALFHLNEIDVAVLPVNYVINHYAKELDIDQDLCFVKVTCNSVDEAKRRAYIVASLTYDIHQGIFVRMATSEMLEDAFVLRNIF